MEATKLETLRSQNPWPDIHELDGQPSYVWSLDGGGRHLIVDLIRERKPKVFLEVGVFVGGSSLQWLQNSSDDMTLLAADIWDHGAENFVFKMAHEPAQWIVDMEPVQALQMPLKEYGIYKVAMHNLRDFRNRVIPLRMAAAKLYSYIKTFGEPDIIYIDANKERQDYVLAHETFPNSILCGDDWGWRNKEGEMVVRSYVYEVAKARDCTVTAERATWVLRPREPNSLTARLAERDATLRERDAMLKERDATIRAQQARERELSKRVGRLEHELTSMKGSRSWKITAPLRRASDLLINLRSRLFNR
jgi:hypothetical protein